jgi:NADH:ubiquinone oxidoreductase subunit F (NADH-binding)
MLTPDGLIAAVRDCGLRGRGGDGYPLAAKLEAVARRRGRPVVVLNGAEGEPASRKDTTMLDRSPHLVLDGAALAAEAVGGTEVVVWLARDPAGPARPVHAAIAERATELSEQVSFRVEYGPRRYIAGEASAVVNHLSGGPAKPRAGPHATERGVHGRPTLVANAETLAQVGLLARHGVRWFRTVGDPDEPGTLLVTLAGAVRRHGVVEIPSGTAIGQVLDAGWPVGTPQAVLVGGYGGGWLPWPYAARVPLTTRGLRAAGGTLGAGLLAVLPADRCGLVETASLAGWLAGESSGQCGPCVNGLPALAAALRGLALGPVEPAAAERLIRWSGMVTGRGLCHHPDGVAQLVQSALVVFGPEIAAHTAGWCSAPDRRPLLPVPRHDDPLERG